MLFFCFFQCGVGGGPRVGGRGVSLSVCARVRAGARARGCVCVRVVCVCMCVWVSVSVSAWFKVYGWLFFLVGQVGSWLGTCEFQDVWRSGCGCLRGPLL